jgi:hypothetical protein
MPCSICKKSGHTKTTCSLKNTVNDLTTNMSDLNSKNSTKNIIESKPIKITAKAVKYDTDTDETDKADADTEKSETIIEENNILSSTFWKNTKAYKLICEKETQIKYYKKNNSSVEVLQLVDLDSKPFGSEAEKIIREIFRLGLRTSSENDATSNGIKIEIKTARYWSGKDECVWQHLESNHDYEIAMFVLLDFTGWKVWCIRKSLLMGDLKEQKIVTLQGKQGHWVKKSAILKYLTPIKTIDDLNNFIQQPKFY